MEIFTALLILFAAGLPTSILTWLLVAERRRTDTLLRQQDERFVASLSAHQRSQLKQIELNDKAMALLRAADPWQFQTIQAMNYPVQYDEAYDPSPEAEAERIAERSNKKDELNDSLTAEQEAALKDLGIL